MFKIGGSSPRAWGIRRSTSWTHTRLPVHPHVRGEYIAARAAQLGQHGSSPRAWGIHISLSHRMDSVRFIPTCVGNTHPPARARIAVSVHPHVRGEYTLAQHGRIGQDGSSPRAWGIPTASCYGTSPPRFIPTCVGNTVPMASRAPAGSVHPHVRGEYHDEPCGSAGYDGSSPRAWGIQAAFTGAFAPVRFIPTCVGNTSMGQCS